jgi:hypothetical protein
MRVLTILLLILATCWAQSEESKVEAVLKQMERAEQTGNFDALVSLFTRQKAPEFQRLRSVIKARPEAQYRAIRTQVHGEEAALLAQGGANSFVTMTLRKEGGQWKIQNQIWSETPPPATSVYALVPPEPGAFARAGAPWNQVPQATYTSPKFHEGWEMKAVFDEAYLYIRIETSGQLPAPGSTIKTPPLGWPVLKVDTSDAGEFVLNETVNVGDQATFDSNGRANSHRAYAAYMVRLEHGDKEVLSAAADLHSSPLVTVKGRDYDVRIPLVAMGIIDSRATKMTIGDAQWPRSAVLSMVVPRYSR